MLLAITIITAYSITSDGHASSRQVTDLLAETGDCFKHNAYMNILYLKCEDAMLAILYMGLPITTTVAGQWLNSLIFHDDNKYM